MPTSRRNLLRASLVGLAFTLIGLPVRSDAQGASPAGPSTQQKLVLSYFHDVLDSGNIELVDSMFQSDCELHFGSSDVKGLAGVHAMVERIKTTYSSMKTEVHDILESGDRVVVRIIHRATGGGTLRSRMGNYDIKGRNISWDAIVIFQFKNGKIAEDWVNRDELGMLLSAGIPKTN